MQIAYTFFSMHSLPKILINSFCWLILFGSLSNRAYSQTLRVIIVAEFDDVNLRSACLKDVEIMSHNFQQISEGINYKVQRIELNRETFTAAAVRTTLDTLTVQPSDVLFFYYTGHGFNTEANQSNYPFLRLKDWQSSPLSLDEVSAKLQGKRARLSISIGDCCNSILPLARGLPLAMVHKGTGVDQDDINRVLQKLFIESCGAVKVSSAQKKQFSNADPVNGSLYTQAFENAFENMLDKNSPELVSWETLLNDSQTRLNVLLKSAEQPGLNPADQSSLSKITISSCSNPGPSPTPPSPAPSTNCITFDVINNYINDLIDNSKTKEERQATMKKVTQFFTETAYVKIYVGDTPVPPNQSIKSWLSKLYLNSGKNILTVNFIEKNSTRTPDCQRFANIAVQEFWKN